MISYNCAIRWEDLITQLLELTSAIDCLNNLISKQGFKNSL